MARIMHDITPPVIILGMHRSGTSCLAGSLQQAGLVLGDVYTENPYNKKGNREHPELMQLHEAVLTDSGGAWHRPPAEVQWRDSHRRQRDVFIRRFAGVPRWGFKDPRALLLLEGWREVFPKAQFVGTVRHPMAVAESLHGRSPNLGEPEDFVALWAEYQRRLLALWRDRPFPVVNFDHDDAAYRKSLTRVLKELGLQEGLRSRMRRLGPARALAGRLSGSEPAFFDPALRTHRRQGYEGLPEDVVRLYEELQAIAV